MKNGEVKGRSRPKGSRGCATRTKEGKDVPQTNLKYRK